MLLALGYFMWLICLIRALRKDGQFFYELFVFQNACETDIWFYFTNSSVLKISLPLKDITLSLRSLKPALINRDNRLKFLTPKAWTQKLFLFFFQID